ncbi:Aldo/keto reductase [Auriscalpium vulgare]|uniref:Aldo/keto reductase n=1 Tax=Auriscalpium vulgare TaxID=40419 RepID=A0ACB8RW98_9AGAM|nr:Aldo/keto reductase [Auriscalpium vulgare]
MSFSSLAPPPPTPLGRYRVLSPLAGVRVSPLILGAMSIGDKWAKIGMGAMDKESSFKLLDAYFEAGGNFIDTANNYQDETSEAFIGEWMETRKIRDQIILATKYTSYYKHEDPAIKQKVNYVGNSAKALRVSVDASLAKLRSEYIDILYVHWWDWGSGVEEIMNALHNLVVSGKVIYLGISDAPAWVVVKANQYARYNGKTPFVIYEGQWNVLKRSFERDIIPMARSEGLALAPWDVLASGKLRTDAEEEERRKTGEKGRTMVDGRWERTELERGMSQALDKVREEVGAKSVQAVAIAYLMQKTTHVFPIVGGRKVEHLRGNIEALTISLSKEQIHSIEAASGDFDPGFPNEMIGDGTEDSFLLGTAVQTDKWPLAEPIRPRTEESQK